MAGYTDNNAVQATEHASAALSDWGGKLRFDRSFYAKLILSERAVKEYYADIATACLKYEKVRASMGWSGVSFTAGRTRIAFIAFRGKTLCLYLALDPAASGESRYKARDVGGLKTHAKTPAMFRVKSEGAKRYALSRVDEAAERAGLSLCDTAPAPVQAKDFPPDTFQNLIARGLVRVIRGAGTAEKTLKPSNAAGKKEEVCGDAYTDTVSSADALLARHRIYDDISRALSEGEGHVELSERRMLRAVDEIWVRAVEDCVPSLDRLIRNPNHFIAETEEVLPIEMTRKITGRSIAHLSRHADYLSPDGNGEITPTKMLNIFRDDSLLTYENKFLNTLLNRLYTFVNKRYTVAMERGVDERLQSLVFENSFTDGDGKGTVRLEVTYSERCNETDEKGTFRWSGIRGRVERLNDIVTGYMQSAFVRTMDKNFIRPPVMRTNAIMKNKYFRECLALWEFIESYEDAGYGITVEEKTKDVSSDYVRELYFGAVTQYFLFRHALDEGYGESEGELRHVRPQYAAENVRLSEEFAEVFADRNEDIVPGSEDVSAALLTALLADEILAGCDADGFSRTFHARLRLADDELKTNFAALSNELLRYGRVKMRHSNHYATYSVGRQVLLRIGIGGKTLKLYFALPPGSLPDKYHAADVSGISRYEATPTMVRVRHKRSVRYALEIIATLADTYALVPADKPRKTVSAADYASVPVADMIAKKWLVPIKRAVFRGEERPAFGAVKRRANEILAEEQALLSVNEGEKSAEKLRTGAFLPKRDTAPGRKTQSAAEVMAAVIRPDGEYDTPTEYGIDDSTGFMQDNRDSEKTDGGAGKSVPRKTDS